MVFVDFDDAQNLHLHILWDTVVPDHSLVAMTWIPYVFTLADGMPFSTQGHMNVH